MTLASRRRGDSVRPEQAEAMVSSIFADLSWILEAVINAWHIDVLEASAFASPALSNEQSLSPNPLSHTHVAVHDTSNIEQDSMMSLPTLSKHAPWPEHTTVGFVEEHDFGGAAQIKLLHRP
jgi:hypothetical protein